MRVIEAIFRYLRQTGRDARAAVGRVARDRAALITILVLALPWWALVFIRANADWVASLGGMIAIAFTFWWMSRSGAMPALQVAKPRAETGLAVALVGWWMLWRTGICAHYFFFLPSDFNCFKNGVFEIAPKVIEQVILPIAILRAAGYSFRAQGLAWSWRAWWIALPALIALSGYGVFNHWNDLAKFGANSVEYFFAAGLPEEVLFRAFLLTRLEAWWRSPAWGLFGSAIIFGLTHLPIDYLVFTQRNWSETWILVLTFQAGFGAVFAFAYQRTRNVLPLAIVHALVDAL